MSTNVIAPAYIKNVAGSLYHLHTSDIQNDSAASRRLTSALTDLFDKVSALDPEKSKHPQQQLFYLLCKGNQKAADNMVASGVMSEYARDEMRGDEAEYKKDIARCLASLSEPLNMKFSHDVDGLAMVSGAFNHVAYHVDDALPESFSQSVSEAVNATRAYALSLDPDCSKEPLKDDPKQIFQDLLSLANKGEMLYEAHRAVSTLVMDKFLTNASYTSGQYREIYGSDALAVMVNDLLADTGTVRVPFEGMETDVRLPTLTQLSGLKIKLAGDIPDANNAMRARLSSTMHALTERLDNVKLVDYNGDAISEDKINGIKSRFKSGVDALDDATIGKYKGARLSHTWAMGQKTKEVERSITP